MATIPHVRFDQGDLKIIATTEFAYEDMNIPDLSTSELRTVSNAFKFNVARLRFMMLLPAHIGDLASMMQHIADKAEFEATGGISPDPPPADKREAFEARWIELFKIEVDRRADIRTDSDRYQQQLVMLRQGASPAEMLGSLPPPFALGLQLILQTYLTSAWTAFETMCGDLWEAAVNTLPEPLAYLNGDRRLVKDNVLDKRFEQRETKTVRLNLLQEHRFDIKSKMGTIHREGRFEFSRLRDIREAYSLAFRSPAPKIDEALIAKEVDALHVVRNVIVHQAGIADSEYIKQQQSLSLPRAETGRAIALDGEAVVQMISPVIKNGVKLMTAVDEWILNHRKA